MRRFLRTGRHDAPAQSSLTTPPNGGLLIWLKADSLALADGAAVNAWPDSQTGKIAAQLGVFALPTFKLAVLNGLPVVRFSSASQQVIGFSNADSGPVLSVASFSYAAVLGHRAPSVGSSGAFGANGNGAHNGFALQTNATKTLLQGRQHTLQLSFGALGVGVFSRALCTYDSVSTFATTYRGGRQVVSLSVAAPAFAAGTQFALGHGDIVAGTATGGNFSNFDLGELLVWDHALGSVERQNVDGYLMDKWGV